MLEKENIIEVYNTLGCPLYLMNDPNLLEKMYSSIEFRATDYKWHKKVIKVWIIKHLHEKIKENYNIYIAKSTLQNYIQP